VTRYVAISKVSQERIAAAYGREANIVHPPVDVDRFASAEPEDFFLTVGELVAHKRLEVALQAVQRVGARVKVVGTGPELARLRSRYGDVTEFLGRVTDAELDSLYARARAYLLPNVEEFGIVAVESQAAGRPVVATGKGGATETIVDGETGILLVGGTVDEFAEALRAVDFSRFDSERIREHAQGFSTARFQAELTAEVERATREGIA
jgi:glycosyltransferase involved in cell wall biosynthesis